MSKYCVGDRVWVVDNNCQGHLVLAEVTDVLPKGQVQVEYEVDAPGKPGHKVPARKNCSKPLKEGECSTGEIMQVIMASLHPDYKALLEENSRPCECAEAVRLPLYRQLREARINKTISQLCGNLSQSPRPTAVFLTGYMCSGKSTFLEHVVQSRSLNNYLHINADDVRILYLGGMGNDKAIRKAEQYNNSPEGTIEEINPVDYKVDANRIRLEATTEAQKMSANFVADSMTIPAIAALQFKRMGYDVSVYFLEIDAGSPDQESDYFARRQDICQARCDVRNGQGERQNVLNVNGIENTRKGMKQAALDMADEDLPVHLISSKDGDFVDLGPLVPCSHQQDYHPFRSQLP